MDFTYNSVSVLALQLLTKYHLNGRCYNKKNCVCVVGEGYMGILYFLLNFTLNLKLI